MRDNRARASAFGRHRSHDSTTVMGSPGGVVHALPRVVRAAPSGPAKSPAVELRGKVWAPHSMTPAENDRDSQTRAHPSFSSLRVRKRELLHLQRSRWEEGQPVGPDELLAVGPPTPTATRMPPACCWKITCNDGDGVKRPAWSSTSAVSPSRSRRIERATRAGNRPALDRREE